MKFVIYLSFDGKCREAFEFYQQVFGGEIVAMITHEDMQIPGLDEAAKKRIMHARLIVGDGVLMGGDSPPEMSATPQGFSASVQVDTPEEADRIFSALADGGTVIMPIEEQMWADRFGMVTDKFGTPWMVNCEKPMEFN
jgi:PhnB protein